MKSLSRALSAVPLLLLPLAFLVCSSDNPTNPLLPTNPTGGGGQKTNLPSLSLSAPRFDLSATGSDSVAIQATARNADGSPMAGAEVFWTLVQRGFSGEIGKLSSLVSRTGPAGLASTAYTPALLEFVPVGAAVTVRGTLSVPNNPQGSPTASLTFVLRPKGAAPTGGTNPGTGLPISPVITSATPVPIKVDASPAVTVIVQGSNFSDDSPLLLVTAEQLVVLQTEFFSTTQLRFTVPTGLKAGLATLFATGPGDLLSNGLSVVLTTGVATGTTTTIPAIATILPDSGPVQKETTVILLGSGFNVETCPGSGNITFINGFVGLQKRCPIEPATATRIVVKTPVFSSTQSGPVSVFVQNDDGTTSNTVIFTVTPTSTNAPAITAISPGTGPTTGGDRITITGANFAGNQEVVIAGSGIASPATDFCDDGKLFCQEKQCVLSAARGNCIINGNPGFDVFDFLGSGLLEIVTPSVGPSSAGKVDVLVRDPATGQPSNISSYLYQTPSGASSPTIIELDRTSLTRDGCCDQGTWQLVILGNNFRPCSSVVISHNGQLHELLPSPDLQDCGIKRGSDAQPSPRERLMSILGESQADNCATRPDLVPFQRISVGGDGDSGVDAAPDYDPNADIGSDKVDNRYEHSSICLFSESSHSYVPVSFATGLVGVISDAGGPNEVTQGGAIQWVSESQIRINWGPADFPGCGGSDDAKFYVSNDPGRGLTGELTSNGVIHTFTDSIECPNTVITSIRADVTETNVSVCDPGGLGARIFGLNFFEGAFVNWGGAVLVPGTDYEIRNDIVLGEYIQVFGGRIPLGDTLCAAYGCRNPPCGPGIPPAPDGAPYECNINVRVVSEGADEEPFTYQSFTSASCTNPP